METHTPDNSSTSLTCAICKNSIPPDVKHLRYSCGSCVYHEDCLFWILNHLEDRALEFLNNCPCRSNSTAEDHPIDEESDEDHTNSHNQIEESDYTVTYNVTEQNDYDENNEKDDDAGNQAGHVFDAAPDDEDEY
ncbi:hypothetical protein LTS08_002888 [Lithohypha guttulata]|nr:hypothetical protein LTS08_002888 [Lithohypha guttulata]